MNYYVVIRGKEGTKIYLNWNECEKNVKGVSGVIFKKFKNENDIENFLKNNLSNEEIEKVNNDLNLNISSNSNHNKIKQNKSIKSTTKKLVVYTDGSYNGLTKEFGSGVVILDKKGDVLDTISIGTKNDEVATMQNVAGEIKAVMLAVRYAKRNNYKELDIYHDYIGVASFLNGNFKAKNKFTKQYVDYMNSQNIKYNFYHIKGHSKNKYNDMADELAKKSIGII